jgi:zinc transporter ZupT
VEVERLASTLCVCVDYVSFLCVCAIMSRGLTRHCCDVLFFQALNYMVTWLLGGHHHHHHHHDFPKDHITHAAKTQEITNVDDPSAPHPADDNAPLACPCCSDDPAGDWQAVQDMASEIEAVEKDHKVWDGIHEPDSRARPDSADSSPHATPFSATTHHASDHGDDSSHDALAEPTDESKKLLRMSLNTALAIGIHNFPEGLATFVAALGDPKVGAVLAVAIAIHNIPEGLCVAMPVYYATGNRWKAFGWAMLSGMSEPVAALLGWAVLASSFSDTLYGLLFGMVAGMMVVISTRELLPTAHRYDPEDCVVTYAFISGMCIMALSLVLFLL